MISVAADPAVTGMGTQLVLVAAAVVVVEVLVVVAGAVVLVRRLKKIPALAPLNGPSHQVCDFCVFYYF